jgi:DNA-binding NarL/FixJ family response regulator
MEAAPVFDPRQQPDVVRSERDGLYERLPNRQRGVLQLLADGLSDEEIASRTGQSEDRVASMVAGLLTELGFGARGQAITWVIRRDLESRLAARPLG